MFIDTNVLVYALAPAAPAHSRARALLDEAVSSRERLTISRQILREYLATVTRPQAWSPPLPLREALDDIARFSDDFEILEDGSHVTDMLISLCRQVPVAGRQVHDANIVATMLASGERRLLTFNVGDFRRYGDRLELVESV